MLKKFQKYLLYFLILVYVSGAIGFVVNPSFFSPFTPYTLLLTSFVFLTHQPLAKGPYLFGFIALALIGYFFEVLGVKTGLVFGEYHYGRSLGYALLGVPLVISLNWAFLISCGIAISKSVSGNVLVKALCSALLISLIDLLIEQTAAQLDFWYFENGSAGIHNFIGWFLISFIASFLFQKYLNGGNKKIALIILSLQVFFFGLIYIVSLF